MSSNGQPRPTGWIPKIDRTPEELDLTEACHARMASFAISGPPEPDNRPKVDLTELWTHPQVTAELGFPFSGIWQQSGSCVGAGGENCRFTLACFEVLKGGDVEHMCVSFWLLTYARSRSRGGMRGRGEGSFGSTYAEAAKLDGYLPSSQAGFPDFEKTGQGLNWGKNTEIDWSDGSDPRITALLEKSRQHLVRSTAPMKSADDVEQAIRNYYPCTNASSLIPNPVVESDGEAYGRVARSGGHQTSFLGVWLHPSKGRLFKYQNQWSSRWGKAGACWIPDRDVDAIIRDGEETYAFSQFDGFPTQKLDWYV